ncbi:MAG: N-acetylmuramoyl-L-alanine amidase [Pseudomonadota bacterium]
MTATFEPDYGNAEVCPSPNFGERKGGRSIDMLIMHYTGMKTGQAAQDWLCNEESQVSCHYIVHEDGRVVQMVREADRAWHAGKSSWQGHDDMNSCSIGIEIVNGGHDHGMPDFTEPQMISVVKLSQSIIARNAIPARRVLAHSDVAPVRKVDPGEKFDWKLLAQSGVGHWIEPTPIAGGRYFCEGESGQPIEALQAMLSLYGYNVEVHGTFDAQTKGVVEAFQRHFRVEKIDGVADFSTIDTLHRLLKSLDQ